MIYQAVPGETPILDGGTAISGWMLYEAARGIYRAPTLPGLRFRQLYVDGVRAARTRGPFRPSGITASDLGFAVAGTDMSTWRNPRELELVHWAYWKSFRCGVDTVTASSITVQDLCDAGLVAPPEISIVGPACNGSSVTVSVSYPNFQLVTPFLGAVIGSQTIPIRASITDTILVPPCS